METQTSNRSGRTGVTLVGTEKKTAGDKKCGEKLAESEQRMAQESTVHKRQLDRNLIGWVA